MKALNIHGYRGNSVNAAFSALAKLGCEVVSPQIDHDLNAPEEVMDRLRRQASEMRPELIAGTSLGGFYAALLASETGLPVILVNPCLMPFYHLPKLGYAGDVRPFISMFGKLSELDSGRVSCIIGGSDEVIDTHFFAKTLFDNERYRIVPEGKHSGATLPLAEYFAEILNSI